MRKKHCKRYFDLVGLRKRVPGKGIKLKLGDFVKVEPILVVTQYDRCKMVIMHNFAATKICFL